MECLKIIWDIFGTIATFGAIVTIVVLIWGTLVGFLPVMFRLGLGLWNRKIVIVARNDELNNLESLLCDSGLFRQKNILRAAGDNQLETISKASVILAYWPDCCDSIETILGYKKANSPLIIYAPLRGGRIPSEVMQLIEEKKHVVVTNFRGRLMNDVVTSMITTANERG